MGESGEIPRIRKKPIPDEAVLVVRGWDPDPASSLVSARRFRARFNEWGRFGLSAFVAADFDETDALCKVPLNRFPAVRIYLRQDLERAGLEVVPTFRTPHVTVAHERLDRLLFALRQCKHEEVPNRYWEGE